MNLVFVCPGNVARSPAAEALAIDWFHRRFGLSRAQQEARGIVIRSASLTSAFQRPGTPATMYMIRAMRDLYGIDLNQHQSQLLSEEMCGQADYLVTFSDGLRSQLLQQFTTLRDKPEIVQTVQFDVPDPWLMDYAAYLRTASLIHRNVDMFLSDIIAEDNGAICVRLLFF